MNNETGLIVVEDHSAVSLSAALSSQQVQHARPDFWGEQLVDFLPACDEAQKTCPRLAVGIETVGDVERVGDLAFLIAQSQALQAGNDPRIHVKIFDELIGELLLVLPPQEALAVVT